MSTLKTGWLVLADISGYTGYLTASELEHAHQILATLMKILLSAGQAPLRLVKLEGDAVFFHADERELTDGAALLARLEDTYFHFRSHLTRIGDSSTCQCAACRNTSKLDLKFFVHFGQYVTHMLTGVEDLEGKDVIIAHRLMKNEVSEAAYILASDAARTRMPAPRAWRSHVESYEHLGPVPAGVLDLHPIYAEMQESGPRLAPTVVDCTVAVDLDCEPPEAWAWYFDEDKRPQWDEVKTWVTTPNAQGKRAVGSETHCVHEAGESRMRIVAWRPYAHMAVQNETEGSGMGWFPACLTRFDFEPIPTGTRVTMTLSLIDRSLRARLMALMMRMVLPGQKRRTAAKLNAILAERRASEARDGAQRSGPELSAPGG